MTLGIVMVLGPHAKNGAAVAVLKFFFAHDANAEEILQRGDGQAAKRRLFRREVEEWAVVFDEPDFVAAPFDRHERIVGEINSLEQLEPFGERLALEQWLPFFDLFLREPAEQLLESQLPSRPKLRSVVPCTVSLTLGVRGRSDSVL